MNALEKKKRERIVIKSQYPCPDRAQVPIGHA
jgi:hypothetical protein